MKVRALSGNAIELELESRINERRLYVAITVILFMGLFAYRVALFSDIEPRSDQAFFSWWVQGLAQADHIFPEHRSGEGFMAALERDDESFLHRLLRPIHGRSVSIFTSVPLFLRLVSAWVFGDGIEVQTISSIFVASLIMLSTGLFALRAFEFQRGGLTNREIDQTALLATAFTGSAYYLHFFSPMGVHNFGVLFLVLAAGSTQRAFSVIESQHESGRHIIIAVLFQILALYAHWTNIFLLPAATLFCLAVCRISVRQKCLVGGYYIIGLLIIAIPFLVFAANTFNQVEDVSNLTVWELYSISLEGGFIIFFQTGVERSIQWFENVSGAFSVLGVMLGLLGVSLMAIRQRIYFPFSLCSTHFVVALTIPAFMGAHFRTDLYMLPFLALGLAYLVGLSFSVIQNVWRHQNRLAFAVLGLLFSAMAASHLWQQISQTGDAHLLEHHKPGFWSFYYKGQGEVQPIVDEINETLPDRAVVVTWGYGMQYVMRNYEIERHGRKVLPTLLTLLSRFDKGTLPNLIKRRDISIPADVPIYALIDYDVDHVDEETVRGSLEKILGPEGFYMAKKITLELQGRWQLSTFWPRDVAVYRVGME